MPSLWDRMRGKTGFQQTPLEKETPQGKVTAADRMEEMRQNLKESRSNSRYKSSDEFEWVYRCVKNLNAISDTSANDLSRRMLEDTHKALGDACKKYLESRAGARTGRGRERYAMVEEIYRLQLDEKQALGNKDVMAAAVRDGTPWKEVLHGSRVLAADTPQVKKFVGSGASTRMAIEVGEKKGFFTPEDNRMAFLIDGPPEDCMKLLSKDIEKKEVRDAIEGNLDVLASFDLYTVYESYRDLTNGKNAIAEAVKSIPEDRMDPNIKGEVVEAVAGMADTIAAANGLKDMALRDAEIEKDENNSLRLNNRNIASSRFAALLDNGELIARSERMILDKSIEGSFMEFAKGEDIKNIGKPEGEKLTGVSNFKDPRFMRQIHNLAIMDYVMAQVDRHPANMFYQVDDKNAIIGVQGIDNDMAFGCRDGSLKGATHLIDINQVKIVDKQLLESLQAMDRQMIDYELGDLLGEREREMLAKRVEIACAHLSDKSKVEVIDPYEWTPDNADHIAAKLEGKGSYFSNAVSDIKKAQKKYLQSVRTPVQESELTEAEKQAPTGGGIQKQAPAAQASLTANTQTVADSEVNHSGKSVEQQAGPEPQPKTANTRTATDNEVNHSGKSVEQQAEPKPQPKTANTRTVADNEASHSQKPAAQQTWQKAQPKGWQKAQPKAQPKTQPSKQSVQMGNRGK